MNKEVTIVTALMVVTIFMVAFGCEKMINNHSEKWCPEQGSAAGLPFKIAKINGWSECYLKCPDSWVPSNGFHGCRR